MPHAKILQTWERINLWRSTPNWSKACILFILIPGTYSIVRTYMQKIVITVIKGGLILGGKTTVVHRLRSWLRKIKPAVSYTPRILMELSHNPYFWSYLQIILHLQLPWCNRSPAKCKMLVAILNRKKKGTRQKGGERERDRKSWIWS